MAQARQAYDEFFKLWKEADAIARVDSSEERFEKL
jgi:hypothetical protein